MVQTKDMFLPSMTSRYMDVGETFGMQANSVGAKALIGSLMSRGGLWHLGSTEFGTVKFCSQLCSASRWQSQCHLFWWSVKSLKWRNWIFRKERGKSWDKQKKSSLIGGERNLGNFARKTRASPKINSLTFAGVLLPYRICSPSPMFEIQNIQVFLSTFSHFLENPSYKNLTHFESLLSKSSEPTLKSKQSKSKDIRRPSFVNTIPFPLLFTFLSVVPLSGPQFWLYQTKYSSSQLLKTLVNNWKDWILSLSVSVCWRGAIHTFWF